MSPDPNYCAACAIEERRLAMAAVDPRVRRVHLELAAKYAPQADVNAALTEKLRMRRSGRPRSGRPFLSILPASFSTTHRVRGYRPNVRNGSQTSVAMPS